MPTQSIKVLRNVLSQQGIDFYAVDAFVAKCCTTWGDGWLLTDAGIVVGAVLALPTKDYAMFMGAAPPPPPDPTPPPPPVEEEAKEDADESVNEDVRPAKRKRGR